MHEKTSSSQQQAGVDPRHRIREPELRMRLRLRLLPLHIIVEHVSKIAIAIVLAVCLWLWGYDEKLGRNKGGGEVVLVKSGWRWSEVSD